MTALQPPVTVLVTGTTADRAALRLAAAEALLRDHALLVLAAYAPPLGAGPIAWSPGLIAARKVTLDALSWLRQSHPHLPLDYRVMPGDPVDAMVSSSADAVALVVPALPGATGAAVAL